MKVAILAYVHVSPHPLVTLLVTSKTVIFLIHVYIDALLYVWYESRAG